MNMSIGSEELVELETLVSFVFSVVCIILTDYNINFWIGLATSFFNDKNRNIANELAALIVEANQVFKYFYYYYFLLRPELEQ